MYDPQEAYVLHLRNFSDAKVLVEFFTHSHGRIKAIARAPNKKDRWHFQAFQPLVISFRGDAELKTLTHSETLPSRLKCLDLKGLSLFCAMYINELVQRVVPLEASDSLLFDVYESALETLARVDDPSARELVLRNFELALLSALGYQTNFFEAAGGAGPIRAEKLYRFDPSTGFIEIFDSTDRSAIKGEWIVAIGNRDFSRTESFGAAKKITRLALKPLLGNRPLKSRELFV